MLFGSTITTYDVPLIIRASPQQYIEILYRTVHPESNYTFDINKPDAIFIMTQSKLRQSALDEK